jgi:aspartate/tyrosine/aromatic aminotransferase
MALFEDGLSGSTKGILVVLGVVLAAPIVLPAVASVSRPLAKTLIKGYLALTDMVKEFSAEAQEQVGDLVAEVKAERTAEVAAAGAAGATHATGAAGKSKPAS